MIYKPGYGWNRIEKSPVYNHTSGIRIHVAGLFKFPNGVQISESDLSNKQRHLFYRFIKINGGNRKRGSMAFSRHIWNEYITI